MTFTIGNQLYRVAEHIWRDHPERIGQVTIDQIRQTILEPERTGPGKYDRVIYWRWFPELSDRGNYLKVIVAKQQFLMLLFRQCQTKTNEEGEGEGYDKQPYALHIR